MAALLDTPSRVLRRVKLYEDMELPSLPSFQQDDLDDLDQSVDKTDVSAEFSGSIERTLENYDEHSDHLTPQQTSSGNWTGDDLTEPTPRPAGCTRNDGAGRDGPIEERNVNGTELTKSGHDMDSFEHGLHPAQAVPGHRSAVNLSVKPVGPPQPNTESALDALLPSAEPQRIPSLSRSELSGTDNEATTPDGSDTIALHGYRFSPSPHSFPSPPKAIRLSMHGTNAPPSLEQSIALSATPKAAIRYMDTPSTAARAAATPFGQVVSNPLSDITPRFHNNDPATVYTPSVDYSSTPRALLDDKERRKSHVLSVLASASLPSRVRQRGTPHPLRRVSVVPNTQSIWEDASTSGFSTKARIDTSPDVSSVSIASSQDLATDRKTQLRYQRGNTSVPDILMSAGTATPGFNLQSDNRPDAVKIQKHLNMMNKQLLDTNAVLAREAEDWRQECVRLVGMLADAGIELDDDGLAGTLMNQSSQSSLELPTLDDSFKAAEVSSSLALEKHPTRSQHSKRSPSTLPGATAIVESEAADTSDASLRATQRELEHLQSDFARKTLEHAEQFAEICQEYEEQVTSLQTQLQDAHTELEQLRQREALEGGPTLAPALLQHSRARSPSAGVDSPRALSPDLGLGPASANDAHKEERIISLQSELTALQQSVTKLKQSLATEQQRNQDLVAAMDVQQAKDAEAQLQAQTREADIERLQNQLGVKEVEIEELRLHTEDLLVKRDDGDKPNRHARGEHDSLVTSLEDRLDHAYHEIGLLRQKLCDAEADNASAEARETRIQALELEKAVLLERLQAQPPSTPGPWARSMMTSTPIVNKVLSSLKTPKTPGQLKELSWLQTTIGDSNETLMRAQLDHLQQELDHANKQLDKNFGRLEATGLGAVQLAEKLAIATDRISQLEDEIQRLCQESQLSRQAADDKLSRTDQLETALAGLREQLFSLQNDARLERERLLEENGRLRQASLELQTRSDREMEAIAREAEDIHKAVEQELEEALERVKDLQGAKHAIEIELSEAKATIKHLRDLAVSRPSADNAQPGVTAQHNSMVKNLQARLDEATHTVHRLQDDLKSRLRDLTSAQSAVESMTRDRGRITAELELFAEDVRKQRKECAHFGHELQTLRHEEHRTKREQERRIQQAEVALQEAQRSLMEATMRATDARQQTVLLERQLSQQGLLHQGDREKLGQKHKAQARRLCAQIDYLKAKYTRENTFRNALSLQKKFLLLLVGGMSLNEQATLKVIATMGLGVPAPPRPSRSLKGVALAVLAVIRAQKASDGWKAVRTTRATMLEAR